MGKICCLDFRYFFVPTHKHKFRGSSSLAYISVAMNHSPSIYLSLLMMAETPHPRERWPEWPLCVITADQWSISICPWSHDLPERQPTAGGERKGGKTREKCGLKGERATRSDGRSKWRVWRNWVRKRRGGKKQVDKRSRKTMWRGRCENGRGELLRRKLMEENETAE